jgi:hypothetical protein
MHLGTRASLRALNASMKRVMLMPRYAFVRTCASAELVGGRSYLRRASRRFVSSDREKRTSTVAKPDKARKPRAAQAQTSGVPTHDEVILMRHPSRWLCRRGSA